MNIATIIPAAGKSTRMGYDKPFLQINGKTIISRQVEIINKAALYPVFIVTNHPAKIRNEIDSLKVQIINAYYKTSTMIESIRLAIKKIPSNCAGAMLLPADFPIEKVDLIKKLKKIFIENPTKIVVPVFEKKRGHPIIVPAMYFKNIISRYDGTGLVGLLQEFPGSIYEMEWRDNSVLNNLNVNEDYKKYITKKRR